MLMNHQLVQVTRWHSKYCLNCQNEPTIFKLWLMFEKRLGAVQNL